MAKYVMCMQAVCNKCLNSDPNLSWKVWTYMNKYDIIIGDIQQKEK